MNNTEKQQKILQMTKDICRHQNVCNDVCKPISACDALRYAERAVEAGYSKQEWISVDEALPERMKTVLVCVKGYLKNPIMVVSEMLEENGSRWSACAGFTVTHWMPLPEPPKMKGGAE